MAAPNQQPSDLLSMFPGVPPPPAAQPAPDPVQLALAKAMAARNPALAPAVAAPPVAVVPAAGAAPAVDLMTLPAPSSASAPWTPDSVFGAMDALDGRVGRITTTAGAATAPVSATGSGPFFGGSSQPPSFGAPVAAQPGGAVGALGSSGAVPTSAAGAVAVPAPGLPVFGAQAQPPTFGSLEASTATAPPVFGAPQTFGGAAPVPAAAEQQPLPLPQPQPQPQPAASSSVPTAAQYLANLKRQQDAQYARTPEPEPQWEPASSIPAPAGPAATATASAAPVQATAPVQTELKLSDLVFPMECVCLKRTVVREGFELSSKQTGQLEQGEKLTVLEGLEGSLGHNSILRVRFNKGWVTMRGVDGAKILGPPNDMVELKMEEATKKLLDGQYKKAAMVFSKVIELDPDHVEAQSGLREAHKGIKFLMMSGDDVDGASKTNTLHLHIGLQDAEKASDDESDEDGQEDDSVATFNVQWQVQGGSARLPVVLFIGFDGVRVQVKNAPQVGAHWEYPAIKGWESSKSHFGFRSEDAYRREERFKFDTHEARLICAKMRSNIGKVMTSATSRFATGTILAPKKK